MLFSIFYFFITTVAYIIALPFLFVVSRIKSKYKESIPARFWLKNNPSFEPNGIWIHLCSFGEAKSIAELVKHISPKQLRVSAITKTGFDEIGKYSTQRAYLPFESLLKFWIRPQKLLIVLEAELWYMLFLVAKQKGAKIFLVNARMSEKSYPKYLRFRWFYKRILANIDTIFAQSKEDKIRFEALGATNVSVTGNIKFANIAQPKRELIKPKGILVCGASTHDKEESVVLDGFRTLKAKKSDSKIAIVPRHPERFESVDKMMASFAKLNGWSYHRFSKQEDFESDMVLVDKMGELVNIYAISDVVVLGGAFEPIGGHNALEAAQFGCKIVSGDKYFNQKEIFAGVEGITIVSNKEELREAVGYPNLLPNTKIVKSANIDEIVSQINKIAKQKNE